jgi:hypothetical protein
MAAPLLSLYSGSGRKVVQSTSSGAAVRQPTAPVKQLLRRLQHKLRRSAARPAPVRFAYDMESYSQNFDGGLGSTDRHYL